MSADTSDSESECRTFEFFPELFPQDDQEDQVSLRIHEAPYPRLDSGLERSLTSKVESESESDSPVLQETQGVWPGVFVSPETHKGKGKDETKPNKMARIFDEISVEEVDGYSKPRFFPGLETSWSFLDGLPVLAWSPEPDQAIVSRIRLLLDGLIGLAVPL